MFNFAKRRSTSIKLFISFVITSQLVFLFLPNLVSAGAADAALSIGAALSGTAAPGIPVKDTGLQTSQALKWNSDFTEKTILVSAMSGLLNGFSYFTRKIAYDAAVYLGSAGKGQGALIYSQGGASYFKSVGLDSVASTVDELGSPFGIKSICNPNIPLEASLKLEGQIKTGLRKLYSVSLENQAPEPNCKWSTIENAIDTINSGAGSVIAGVQAANKLNGYDLAAIAMANSLKMDETDIGKVFTLMAAVEDQKNLQLSGAQQERLEGKGFKAVVDPISGKIKTPADLVGLEAQTLTSKNVVDQSSQQIAGLYGSDLWAVIPAATGLFINTFASQLMNTVLSGGLFTDDSTGSNSASNAEGILSEFAGVLSRNKEIAQNAFNFVFTAVPTQETSVYPLMNEFSACSDSPGLNNCVADSGLKKGVDLAASGQALTIQQAMDPKYNVLHPNWPLIGPSREIDNVLDAKNGKKCYLEKYCYSNLQKLRKARILPLGFEIAALKADPDHPENWTLKKVVDGFNDCNDQGKADEKHKFCHLIDPNWLIRLPEPRCDAKVYTTSLISNNSNLRTNECADVSTCIAEDENGKCLGAYGYCLREKNTWKIPGKSCPAQFSTCKTYVKSGSTEPVSYLSRTLVVGQCNVQSIGCRTYSVKPLANGSWANSSQPVTPEEIKAGKNSIINFNASIKTQSCPGNMEGCSALFRSTANGTRGEIEYVKKAPATLFDACYLVTSEATGKKVWPETEGEIATIKNRPEAKLCAPFAPACTREEAGCEAFKPADGGDTVTGIIGSNQCSKSCVGYDTFKQEQPENKSAFEPAVFPMHFIPSSADSCVAADEGCSEFTNIDKAASGGEAIENYSDLQYCEKPNSTNQKTYYSWEGTVNQGYVLRTHALRPISADNNDRYSAASLNDAQLQAGSPAYSEYDLDILQKYLTECNQTTYEAGLANPYGSNVAKPDCRALYDAQGKIYYRLLNHTVSVSPACHPLRKSESFLKPAPQLVTSELCSAKGGKWNGTANSCEVCYAGGLYQNGSCIYWSTGLPDEVKICQPKAVGCRAYTGKANNNVQVILDNKFEPELSAAEPLIAAKKGWQSGTIKPESVTVGQYSLEITNTKAVYTFPSSTLETGRFYELEFWARGNPQNLDIYFYQNGVRLGADPVVGRFTLNPVTNQIIKAPISATWQAYRVGPVQFTGDSTGKIDLVLESSSNQPYYLDNVHLSKISDKLFLVKNSWKEKVTFDGETVTADVPLACDADPTDGLPGVALGCRAYTDSLGRAENTTGFDRLCRSDAVGCTAFTDSNNTINNTEAVAFNLWCTGEQNTVCTIKLGARLGSDPKIGEIGSCTVPAGQTGCYVKRAVIPPSLGVLDNKYLTPSSIVVPADTTSTLYLSLRKEFKCENRYLGCQKVALEEQTLATSTANAGFTFATTSQTTVLNNPDNYEKTLCSASEVGCGEYKSDNTLSYFKDPSQIGNKICEYKENVTVNPTLNPTGSAVVSGWFKKDVGRCSNQTKVLCKANSDCGGGTCLDKGAVGCYDNYFSNGEYGIWSNKSAEYKDFVGVCPAEYSQCTELRDPADTSDPTTVSGSTIGKSYFVIYDAAAKRAANACEGKAGLKDGCVLFDQTENPTKLYDSVATKTASEKANPKYGLVTPVSGSNNDTNVLLKVEQNRQCSEWLSCKNMVTAIVGGKERKVCYEYKSCRKVNDILECGEWASKSEQVTGPLNEDVYTSRDTSWYGQDYSGYSLFNKFPISGIAYMNVTSTDNGDVPQQYAGFEMNKYNLLADPIAFSCEKKDNFETCGVDGGGRCFNKKCIYPLNGSFKSEVANNQDKIIDNLLGTSCKMYPEQDSPFPQSVAVRAEGGMVDLIPANSSEKVTRHNFIKPATGYEGVGQNVCQSKGDCSCEYQKVTYKSGVVDYWPLAQNNIPSGVCSGGDKDGRACAADADCSNGFVNGAVSGGGVCSLKSKYEYVAGLRGVCLEYDYSRPISATGQQGASFACLTWLPISAGLSNFDSYNNRTDAGYDPTTDAKVGSLQGGEVYCKNATANGQGAVNSGYFTLIQPDANGCANNNNVFECNQKVYRDLFNKYGDYIGDTLEMVGFKTDAADSDILRVYNANGVVQPPYRTLIKEMRDPIGAVWLAENTGSAAAKCEYWQLSGKISSVCGATGPNGVSTGYPYAFGFTNNEWIDGYYNNIFDLGAKNLIGFKGTSQNGSATDYLEYPKRLYSLMQLWAWHGGMYGKGLANAYPRAEAINQKDCSGYSGILQADCLKNAKEAFLKQMQAIRPGADDTTVTDETVITNPGATVLFTSALYYRDYLFTSLRTVDVKKSTSNLTGFVGYERRPLHEGNYLETVSAPHKFFLSDSVSYESPESNYNSLLDGSSNVPYFRSNNRTVKQKDKKSFDPVFPNYEANYKLYDDEISAMHFGPLMIPSRYDSSKTDDGVGFPTMINFDFDALRSAKFQNLKSEKNGYPYELQSIANADGNLYYFRINKSNNSGVRYLAIAMSDKPEDTDLVGFFKPLIDAAVENSGTLGKMGEWQTADKANRSLLWVFVDFDSTGKMTSDFKNNYDAWYRDTGIDQIYEDEKFRAHNGITPFLAVVAELHPRCAEFGIVHNNQAAFGDRKDKAWTDRLWQYTSVPLPSGLDVTGAGYVAKNTAFPLYGSTWLSKSSFEGAEEIPNTVPKTSLDWSSARRKYVFADILTSGVMYNCTSPAFEPNSTGAFTQDVQAGKPGWAISQSLFSTYGCASVPNPDWNKVGQVDVYDMIPRNASTDSLTRLFAAYYQVVKNTDNNRNWQKVAPWTIDNSGTITALPNEKLLPPQIYSLNPTTCYSNNANKSTCLAGEANNVTVNRINGTTTDYNGDGLPDENGTAVIGQGGALPATLQFFGFADHNRMPIARVMVDWGDGSIMNENTSGRYQNHKPFCIAPGEESAPKIKECAKSPYLTCREDADCPKVNGYADTCSVSAKRFGNSERACFAKYFEFYHGYDCSQELINLAAVNSGVADYIVNYTSLDLADHAQLVNLGITAENTPKVCVFKPKVQLMDNWGWCTGSCSANGCFNDTVQQRCEIKKGPNMIPYQGKIIVVPN